MEKSSPKEDVLDFIKGFLQGFIQDGEGDLQDVLDCIKEIFTAETYQKIWNELNIAVQDLKSIDILHWDSIQKALLGIFTAVFDIYNTIKPCITGVKELEVIISLLSNLNPAALLAKVGKNLIFHGGKLLSDLIDIYHQYQKGNWTKMGYDTADFIYNLLLKAQLEDDSTAYLLIKGILEGIAGEGADVTDLLTCVSDFKTIETDYDEMISELDQIIHHMRLRDISKIIHALKYVFDDLKAIFQEIEDCGKAVENIGKLIDVFLHDDIFLLVEKFALNLIKHFGSVFEDITQGVANYKSGQYEASGKFFGQALFEVFCG